jgi:hypothetical protein
LICTRILDDEASHLKYQASMLARVASARSPALRRAFGKLHRFFLLATLFVVWNGHHPAFEAADYDFRRFRNETLDEFTAWSLVRTKLVENVLGGSAMAAGKLRSTERRA